MLNVRERTNYERCGSTWYGSSSNEVGSDSRARGLRPVEHFESTTMQDDEGNRKKNNKYERKVENDDDDEK